MCEIAQPCPHMRILANRYVDGSLSGILLAYAKAHLAQCKQCQRAVDALRGLRDHLAALRTEPVPMLGDDRWSVIRREMEEARVSSDASP